MMISRRKFLESTTITVGAALSLGPAAFGQEGPTLPPYGDGGPLARMTFLTFYENLHTDFNFLNKDGDLVPLKLFAVEDQRPTAKQKWGTGQENFLLAFSGHWRFRLPQGTYEVSHFKLGKFELFITEAGKVGSDNRYVAIINRVDS